MTLAEPRSDAPSEAGVSRLRRLPRWPLAVWLYVVPVVVGAVFVVISGLHQPLNQNEMLQIAPYGSNSIHKIVAATRQPPLDPLAGALVQHVFGVGQLQQRLIPILAGIGMLVFLALLLWRLPLGVAGAFGLWMVATAPLYIRYSGYTRP